MKNSWNLDKDCSKRFTLYFPGSPIQSDTDTSLGSMQPYAANNARRLLAHIPINCLLPDIHLYSCVNVNNVE